MKNQQRVKKNSRNKKNSRRKKKNREKPKVIVRKNRLEPGKRSFQRMV
jgi:hypothetical protein